jgi:fructokinase
MLGREAVEFVESQGLTADTIQIDTKNLTGAAMISLDKNGVPTFSIEENRAYDFINISEDIINLIMSDTECLYFGTLAQRNTVSRTTLQSFFNKGIKYFYDVNIRQNYYTEEILSQSLKTANVLKLNLDELKLLHKIFLESDFDIHSSSKLLMKKFGIDMLAVTKGADGSILFRGEEKDEHKTEVQNVIDTVGAGDAFASILCLGYLNKWNLKKINRLANEFAAEICLINGALPKGDEIYERYKKEITP